MRSSANLATITPAPAASVAEPAPSLEQVVGELVAATACAIAAALREFEHGGLTHQTKMSGGDLIAELHTLRVFMLGTWDFDRIAKTEGARVLLELCGTTISAAMIDELIGAVLDIVRKVARAALN